MSANDQKAEFLKGTLDMLILQALRWGASHGYGIAQSIRSGSSGVLQVETGSLYPALQRLERRDDTRHELHDDRRVDVGVHAQGDDREGGQTAAREEVEQLQEGLRVEHLRERFAIDAGDRHVREHAHDHEHAEDVEDPAPDIRRPEGVDERVEHGDQSAPAAGVAGAAGAISCTVPPAASILDRAPAVTWGEKPGW